MENFVKTVFALTVIFGVATALILPEPSMDNSDDMSYIKDADKMHPDSMLERTKREDVVKFLIDAVDDDIDKCGSPLQLQNDQVTVSVESLTCIVQALVDSLNAGPGLLRKLLDNILKKRDLEAVSLKSRLSATEQECAMKAILKEAIDIVREEHSSKDRRHKRRTHNGGESGRCDKIEKEIEKSMKEAKEKNGATH